MVRTNCLDCLDRTNFVQTKIGLQIVESIIKMLGFKVPRPLHEDMDSEYSYEMVAKLKSIWADNGDMISRHYTGIDSTHTE